MSGGRFAAFRHPGFLRYWLALILTGLAFQMQTVAVGWQVYDLTRDPFDLGLVGLTQFAPALVLVLITGMVADRLSRRRILGACLIVQGSCAAALFWFTRAGLDAVGPVFAVLAVFGTARAFYNPARQAIVPNLVPPDMLAQAIALNTTGAQVATICGPVAGGLLYGLAPGAAYVGTLVFLVASGVLILTIPQPAGRRRAVATGWQALSGGIRYIWREKVVLGAISLDLFAVLLGGATALLPVFARDVLEVGPAGLGMLRSASAVGAIAMGAWLIARPVADNAGGLMFAAVAAFGLFTLVFAVSQAVWLSVAMLACMGAADMISVNIRNTLVQLWTPDELRGRVNAVNQVFIGASNEVGGFRAGSMAALIGPVAAVAVGAAGTLAVTGLWIRGFPELRRIRYLARE